ncbi:hypothetical protein STEG23_018656, partial [Scotinomys teguina]
SIISISIPHLESLNLLVQPTIYYHCDVPMCCVAKPFLGRWYTSSYISQLWSPFPPKVWTPTISNLVNQCVLLELLKGVW